MKVQQLLAHHGIAENPFGQEDAQTDHIFKRFCLDGTHHPAWDKIYGDPDSPATAVVFGEKGSGKTALRLQIVGSLVEHNRKRPDSRAFIVEYDDFNPFLDRFRDRLHGRRRRPERTLGQWRLWDHMDAILSLAVTRLARSIVTGDAAADEHPANIGRAQLQNLSRQQKRDLLLLAALYDHSFDRPPRQRWGALRRKIRFNTLLSGWDLLLAIVVTIATVALILRYGEWRDLWAWWAIGIVVAGWLPWLLRQAHRFWTAWRVSRQIRVLDHHPNTLRRILARFQRQELASQPVPTKERSDDRYELLFKLQSVLRTLGYRSIVVLVDRVDEPHLINGSPERIRDLVWPMFDNKFLKHPGLGFKLLLPAEVVYYLNREKQEFYERSRLDKQNLVTSLEWTGESLYDVANDRIRACAESADRLRGGFSSRQSASSSGGSPLKRPPEATRHSGGVPSVRDLFEESIGEQELIGIFARMRVPRNLFKFLYRLLVDHCNRFTDENPSWQISRETLQSTLAVYTRDLEAFEQGTRPGT